MELLKRDDRRDVQSEAALALGIIASSVPWKATAVLQAGACGQLIQLLSSPSIDVAKAAVWALATIGEGSPSCRDKILDLGVIHALTSLITPAASPCFLALFACCLHILNCDKNPEPSEASLLALHRGLCIDCHDCVSPSQSPPRDSGRILLVSIASSIGLG